MSVRVDPIQLANLLRSPQGPVVRHTAVVANRVRNRAREHVGKQTRQLERSIVTRFDPPTGGWWVGSQQPYALVHHEGSRPHVIRARRGKVLVFYWPKAGRQMFLPQVNHPGTAPNRYLVQAVIDVTGRIP